MGAIIFAQGMLIRDACFKSLFYTGYVPSVVFLCFFVDLAIAVLSLAALSLAALS